MDLRLINYFLALCEEKTFTAAAQRLNITQPTLSKEIKNLEYELGKTLIIRGKKEISLTEEGLYLKRHGQDMIDLSEKIELGIKNFNNEIEGDVYIGSAETEFFEVLSDTIHDVIKDYPRIRFHIFDGNTDDIQNQIDMGTLSFGLIFSSNFHEKYHYLSLSKKNCWGILVPNDDELTKKQYVTSEEVNDKPLILSSRRKSMNAIIPWLKKDIESLNIIGYANLLYNATFLVKKKCGYVFTINGLNQDPDLTFIPLNPPIFQYPKIIWKRHSSFSKAERIFLSYLKETVLKMK